MKYGIIQAHKVFSIDEFNKWMISKGETIKIEKIISDEYAANICIFYKPVIRTKKSEFSPLRNHFDQIIGEEHG